MGRHTPALTNPLVLVERSADGIFVKGDRRSKKRRLRWNCGRIVLIDDLFVKGNRRSKNGVRFGMVEVCLAKEI